MLYHYKENVELKIHKDRDIFKDKVIILNLCKDLVCFKYDGKNYWLKNGEIIEINGRKLHGVGKCISKRFSLSFRNVKY